MFGLTAATPVGARVAARSASSKQQTAAARPMVSFKVNTCASNTRRGHRAPFGPGSATQPHPEIRARELSWGDPRGAVGVDGGTHLPTLLLFVHRL